MSIVPPNILLFRKSFESENVELKLQSAEKFLADFKKMVRSVNGTKKSIDNSTSAIINACFDALIDFSKTSTFLSLKSGNMLNDFIDESRELVIEALRANGNKEYFTNLWRQTVRIISHLGDSLLIDQWRFTLDFAFTQGICKASQTNDILHSTLYPQLKPRLQYLLESVSKKEVKCLSFWLYLIVNVLLPKFMCFFPSYKSDNDLPTEMPAEIRPIFLKFLMNQSVRDTISFSPDDPSTCIAIVAFFHNYDNNSNEFFDSLSWFIEKWTCLSGSTKMHLNSILLTNSPLCVFSVVVVIAKHISRVLNTSQKSDKDYTNIWASFLSLRDQWGIMKSPGPNTNQLKQIITIMAGKARLMGLVIILYIFFDFKIYDSEKWSLISELSGSDDITMVLKRFSSILGISFSYLFIGFTYSNSQDYSRKVSERNLRGGDKKADSFVPAEHLCDVFNSPALYEDSLFYESKFKKEFKIIEKRVYVKFFEPISTKWTIDDAIIFIRVLLGGVNDYVMPQIFESFIMSLTTIREIVPLAMRSSPNLIYEIFFPIYITISQQISCNTSFITAGALSSLQTGSMKRNGIDPNSCDHWISILIRHLCDTTETLKQSIYIVLCAIPQFVPHSHILIPFVLVLLTQKSIDIKPESLFSFLLTSFSICESKPKFMFPNSIERNIETFPKSLPNKDLFHTIRGMMKSSDVDDTIIQMVRATVLSIYADPLGKPIDPNVPYDIVFNAFTCLLISETFMPHPPHQMIGPILKGLNPSTCLKSMTIPNIRSFCSLRSILPLLSSKFIGFTYRYQKMVMSLADSSKYISRLSSLLSIAAFVSLGNSKAFFSFRNKILQFRDRLQTENNESISYAIENLASFFGPNHPPYNSDQIKADAFVVSGGKNLCSIQNNDTVFCFSVKTPSSFVCYESDMFLSSSDDDEPAYPLEDAFEEEYVNVSDSIDVNSLSTIFQIPHTSSYKASSKSIDFSNESATIKIRSYHPDVTKVFKPLFENPVDQKSEALRLLSRYPSSYSFISTFLSSSIGTFIIQKSSKQFQRLCSPIMSLPTRECLKIGVIYVAPNQFDQSSILSNIYSTSSPDFQSFLSSLGCVVNMNNHLWYNGKLEGSVFQNNPYSIYYEDPSYEIMFHISTLLPNEENDPQRLMKKKHIGNDNVHIVWCENDLGYDTNTITSQFNDAHIVIYPFRNDQYRVAVTSKSDIVGIGPLPRESIVTSESLVHLVRTTAIIADRAARIKDEQPAHLIYKEMMKPLLQAS